MKKIFLINGYPQSGKDEFVLEMMRQIDNVYNVSSVDKVKQAATLLGWDGEKSDENRNILSELKDISSTYWDGPFEYMSSRITYIDNGIIFLHIREPDEIEKMLLHFPEIKTILIERDSSIKNSMNHADQNVNCFDYDFIIDNNGDLEDLKNIVTDFIKENINE